MRGDWLFCAISGAAGSRSCVRFHRLRELQGAAARRRRRREFSRIGNKLHINFFISAFIRVYSLNSWFRCSALQRKCTVVKLCLMQILPCEIAFCQSRWSAGRTRLLILLNIKLIEWKIGEDSEFLGVNGCEGVDGYFGEKERIFCSWSHG